MAEAFFARHLGGAWEPVGRGFDGSSHEVRAGDEMLREMETGVSAYVDGYHYLAARFLCSSVRCHLAG
jgi:hypothetical protein